MALALVLPASPSTAQTTDASPPQTVYFPSADGKTQLTGYLYLPAGPGPHPAIVLLHGRGGPYSINVNAQCTQVGPGIASACDAGALTLRHRAWARYWAERGYVALHVDSFGPRGVAHGFGRHTHGAPERAAVNELDVRPLDAQGALAWLAARADVAPARIALQGWSNGASTAINVMIRQARRGDAHAPAFAAALVFYPGCGARALLSQAPRIDVPLQVLLGSADDEVSSVACQRVMQQVDLAPGTPAPVVTLYADATHDFDDPGKSRQSVEANRMARGDAVTRLGPWLEQMMAVRYDALPSEKTGGALQQK
ncbi:dienelactone hydrolase family protein [Herbaspirillum sp. LeCh32-8]|uniref:dienelactone hydrolase family protein n=1 Tax=Herbaspirillum sp. LeCh32-8 TaxID=2821356 RepID=UPI001AEB2C05|nr:dienelactone hydrolase family protein [Herbaspirillum sp. LeCh32-8]MBP0596618.1 dienelactone hydrolase family protein [Herbaspirillum sp. LeCh32-8]